MLIWAASGIAIKQVLHTFTPLTMIILRFTLASLLMLIIGCLFRHNPLLGLQRLDKKDVPLFLLGSFFQPFLYYILETYSYKALSSPTIAEALLSTAPILSPFFAYLLLKERVTLNNILGIIVSTAGMLMLVMVGADNFELGNPWGVPLAIAAVSTAVLYTVVLRRIPQKYNSLSIVFYIQTLALLFFYPLWGIKDAPQIGTMIASWQYDTVWWQSLSAIGYLAVFSSVVAFICYCYSTRQIGVTAANTFNNIRPVFTALIMLMFFGEHLPPGKVIGIVLIIVGLFVSQKPQRQ